ncbi:hypothetical protein BASA81_000881 [Batrachochytrium salamandrivorans]|nr:hypothetical protein BASA81_000881 [Batrachochytrium salamandrivorans]
MRPRLFSVLAKLPSHLDQTSVSVSKIISTDNDGLLSWASHAATEELKSELVFTPEFEAKWPALQRRAIERFKQIRTNRAEIGKRIHNAIEELCLGQSSFDFGKLEMGKPSDIEVVESARAFQKWLLLDKYEILHSEYVLKSERSRFHGRADAFARDKKTGEICLLEYKTKFGELDSSVQLQTAAYVAAYNEALPPDTPLCTHAVVVQIMFNPTTHTSTVRETVHREQSAALALFQCQNLAYRLRLKI